MDALFIKAQAEDSPAGVVVLEQIKASLRSLNADLAATEDRLSMPALQPSGEGVLQRLASFMLDRPLPWQRDCSCCYEECPSNRQHLHSCSAQCKHTHIHTHTHAHSHSPTCRVCIAGSDGRLLACKGPSLRQTWVSCNQASPILSCACILAVVLLVLWTVGTQLLKLVRWPPPRVCKRHPGKAINTNSDGCLESSACGEDAPPVIDCHADRHGSHRRPKGKKE